MQLEKKVAKYTKMLSSINIHKILMGNKIYVNLITIKNSTFSHIHKVKDVIVYVVKYLKEPLIKLVF